MKDDAIPGEPVELVGLVAAVNKSGDGVAHSRTLADGRVQITVTGRPDRIRRALVGLAHPDLFAAWAREKSERAKT